MTTSVGQSIVFPDKWVFYILCLLIIGVPLVFSFQFTTYNSPKYALLQILVSLMILGILIRMQPTSQKGMRTPLDLPLVLFLSWSGISSLNAINPHESLRFILEQISVIGLYFVITRTLRGKEEIIKILWLATFAGFLVALYGLFQYLVSELPFSDRYLDVKSTLGYPNYLGQYLILVLPLAVSLLFLQKDLKVRSIPGICSGTMLVTLLLTRSRGAWLGLGVASFLAVALGFYQSLTIYKPLVLFFKKDRKASIKVIYTLVGSFLLLVLLLGISFAFLSPFHNLVKAVLTDISSILDPEYLTNAIRLFTWKATLQMVFDHPWLGVGAGNFKLIYPLYRPQEERELSGANTWMVHTHNDYLQILAETGPIGLILFLIIIYQILKIFICSINLALAKEDRYLLIGLGVGILATLIQTFFDFNLQNPVSGSYFWILVGLLVNCGVQNTDRELKNLQSPVRNSRYLVQKVLYTFRAVAFVTLVIGIFSFGKTLVADYHLRQAELLSGKNQTLPTLVHIQQASKLDPSNISIRFFAGKTYEEAGRYDEAIREYQECLRLHPYYENAHNNLGTVLARKGLYLEAKTSYEKAIQINPFFVESHQNLGLIYYHLHQPEKARLHLEKAIEINPATLTAYKILGLVYRDQLKDNQKAVHYWEAYLKLNPQDKRRAELQKEIDRIKEK